MDAMEIGVDVMPAGTLKGFRIKRKMMWTLNRLGLFPDIYLINGESV